MSNMRDPMRDNEPRSQASPLDDSSVAEFSWRILAAARRAGGDAMSDLATHLSDPTKARDVVHLAIEAPNAPLSGFAPVEHLLTTQCGIEVLRAMKVRAKRDLGPEQLDLATRRAAMLAFGLAVAAMLVQHRTLGTRAPTDSIEELLLILCGAEVSWVASLGAQALVVLGDLDGDASATRIA